MSVPFFWQPVSSKLDLQNLYFFKSLHWESSHLTPRHGSAVFLSSLSSAHTWDSSPPGTLCFSIVLKIAFPPNLKVSSKRPRVHLPLHLCRWPWQNRDHSLFRDPPPLSPPHCLASYFFYETISWGRWPALHPPTPWLLIDLLSSHSRCGVKKDHVIYVVSASKMLEWQ